VNSEEILEGIPSSPSFLCGVIRRKRLKMSFEKKLGKELMKVWGGDIVLLYLFIGNDESGFWVWNYYVFFHFLIMF
jgi:hypothetical protein